MHVKLNESKEVKKQNLEHLKKGIENFAVGLVHAEWCGHCKNFRSEWDKFVSSKNKDLVTFEVESEQLQKLKQQDANLHKKVTSEVIGYPTILAFKDGKYKYYDGARDSESLLKFVEKIKQEGDKAKKPKQALKQTLKKPGQPAKKTKKGGDSLAQQTKKDMTKVNQSLYDWLRKIFQ